MGRVSVVTPKYFYVMARGCHGALHLATDTRHGLLMANSGYTPLPMKRNPVRPDFVVGIGASAGGLKAFEELLPGLPAGNNAAYIFLQHSATHESGLKEVLKGFSPLPLCMATDGLPLEGDTLYLCPPGALCKVAGDRFHVKTAREYGPRHTVDSLFSSLARSFPDYCAGIILSGSGMDGVTGLQEIKAAGGWAFVQDPATAQFPGMPQSALNQFLADFVRSPRAMGGELLEVIRLSRNEPAQGIANDQEKLHMLLDVMENQTGFNFRRYKEPMLLRRIKRRMAVNRVNTLGEYLLLAKNSPEEANQLVKDVFITVTEFFRDPKVFKRMEKLFERQLKDVTGRQPLRIWSAGCATGEEAYSIALVLAGLMKDMDRPVQIRIFATDVDEVNIRFARKGIFSQKAVDNIPEKLLHDYFDRLDDGWQVNARLREMVVFARHDVSVDTSFSNMDLICCRNLLIYFNRQTQRQLLRRLHYALKPDGYLLLGPSEGIGYAEELFKPVDRQASLYQKLESRILPAATPTEKRARPKPGDKPGSPFSWQQRMRAIYFDEYAPPAVLVNGRLELIHVHGNVQPYLSLSEGDFNYNLLHLAPKELKADIQMVLNQALRTGATVRSRPVKLDTGGRKRKTDNRVISLVAIPQRKADAGEEKGSEILLLFQELPAMPAASTTGADAGGNEYSRALEEELAVTRDQLQANIEALETSNQELQSVNEEFQSTMEELQSANEEFQTANEELESANEELITVNEEITVKSRELALANRELDSILNVTLAGIIVVDGNLRVIRHSDNCRRLFELWPDTLDNVHQLLSRLEGLTAISPQLEKALKSGEPDKLDLQIGGRHFIIHLIPVREKDDASVGRLIIAFYDETATRERARESELLAAIVRGSDDAIIVHDLKGNIRHWNVGAQGMFGYSQEQALTLNVRDLVARGEKRHYTDYVDDLVAGGEQHALEIHGLTVNGHTVDISSSASLLRDHNGKVDGIAAIFRDISEKNAIEDRLNAVVESTPDPFIIVEADGTIQRVNRQAEVLFGYTRAEMSGQSFKLLVPERFRKQHDVFTRNYQQKPVMRQMGAGLALSCLTKSGEEIPVDISLSPVVVGNNTTIMVRFRDIRIEKTEQNRLQEAMRRADEASRTKTRFLAAASHDLRQPLQSISMYLGALAGQLDAGEKTRVIDQTRMAVDTSNKLLNALLNISKLESGKVVPEIESFGIDRLLERVYNTEAPHAAKKNQDFATVYSSVRVTTDPALLEQLVTNLVANAIKYSPPHSHIVLGCRRGKTHLRIKVADNGPGIRTTELDSIFDEYRQLEFDGHYLGKGLGLGLSIVKLITELLDLKLEVKSRPGKGSSFNVLVPVAKAAAKKEKRKPTERSGKKPRTGRILLIEDDAAVLDSTALFLEMSGHTVLAARNSTEAMTALEGGCPDIIVTDFGLAQEENGIELVARLRKQLEKNVPAIVITGDTSVLRGREAKIAGCSIIAKPIEAQALLQALANVLAKNLRKE